MFTEKRDEVTNRVTKSSPRFEYLEGGIALLKYTIWVEMKEFGESDSLAIMINLHSTKENIGVLSTLHLKCGEQTLSISPENIDHHVGMYMISDEDFVNLMSTQSLTIRLMGSNNNTTFTVPTSDKMHRSWLHHAQKVVPPRVEKNKAKKLALAQALLEEDNRKEQLEQNKQDLYFRECDNCAEIVKRKAKACK